jgi:hypothetical protein
MSSLSGETKNKPHPVRHPSVADNASEAAGEESFPDRSCRASPAKQKTSRTLFATRRLPTMRAKLRVNRTDVGTSSPHLRRCEHGLKPIAAKNVTAVQQPALLEKQWLTCTSKLAPVEAVAQNIVLNVRGVHAIAASRKQCERGARHRRDQGPVRSGGKASGRCRQ